MDKFVSTNFLIAVVAGKIITLSLRKSLYFRFKLSAYRMDFTEILVSFSSGERFLVIFKLFYFCAFETFPQAIVKKRVDVTSYKWKTLCSVLCSKMFNDAMILMPESYHSFWTDVSALKLQADRNILFHILYYRTIFEIYVTCYMCNCDSSKIT